MTPSPTQAPLPSPSWRLRRPLLSREPLRTPYIILFLISALLIRCPLWTLLYLSPSRRPRPSWTCKQAVIVRLIRHLQSLLPSCEIQLGSNLEKVTPSWTLFKSTFHILPALPTDWLKGFVATKAAESRTELKPVHAYWFVRGGPAAEGGVGKGVGEWVKRSGKGDKVALVAHGGAYVVGGAHERSPTGSLPRLLIDHIPSVTSSLSIDYRLAPSAGFPAYLVDALAAYKYLIDQGVPPDCIVLSGHSAGANLMLALTRYIRDHEQLPMPSALLLFSPWCDISLTSHAIEDPQSSSRRNFECDILGEGLGHWAQERILGTLEPETIRSAYLSPCAKESELLDDDGREMGKLFKGFPRTLAIAGGAEQILDEIRTLRARMALCGVDVTLDEEAIDAPHDYVTMGWRPDAGRAWERVVRWFESADRMDGWMDRVRDRFAERQSALDGPAAIESRRSWRSGARLLLPGVDGAEK